MSIQDKTLGGRTPFDKLMMFKIIIGQRYYNLEDEQCELQIKDCPSFMDFLGINLHDKVLYENTIWTFKEQLKDSKSQSNFIQPIYSQTQ